MLFKKAKKLNWQHVALIGLVCAAISLLVTAAMVVLPTLLMTFAYGNSLFFLQSWLVMTTAVLLIAAQILVILGPPVYYVVKKKKIEYGMKILFSTLLFMIGLVLLVVVVSYLGWGEPYDYSDLLY